MSPPTFGVRRTFSICREILPPTLGFSIAHCGAGLEPASFKAPERLRRLPITLHRSRALVSIAKNNNGGSGEMNIVETGQTVDREGIASGIGKGYTLLEGGL